MRHYLDVKPIVEKLAVEGPHSTPSKRALAEMVLMMEKRLTVVEAQLRHQHDGPLGQGPYGPEYPDPVIE